MYRLLYSTLCFLFSRILNQIINFPKSTSYILLSKTHYELHNNYKGKQIYFWVGKNIFDEKEIVTSQKRNLKCNTSCGTPYIYVTGSVVTELRAMSGFLSTMIASILRLIRNHDCFLSVSCFTWQEDYPCSFRNLKRKSRQNVRMSFPFRSRNITHHFDRNTILYYQAANV